MGGSQSPPSFNPVTNPYDPSMQAPSLQQQQGATTAPNAALLNQLASRGGGVQDAAALQNAAQGQTLARQKGNANLTQQDFENRIGEMNAINNPKFEQQQLGARDTAYDAQQQNDQAQGATSAALSAAKLLYMLHQLNGGSSTPAATAPTGGV